MSCEGCSVSMGTAGLGPPRGLTSFWFFFILLPPICLPPSDFPCQPQPEIYRYLPTLALSTLGMAGLCFPWLLLYYALAHPSVGLPASRRKRNLWVWHSLWAPGTSLGYFVAMRPCGHVTQARCRHH